VEQRVLVTCPHCKQGYRVRHSQLGRQAKCSSCSNQFELLVPDYHKENEIMDWLEEAGANQSAQAPDATAAGLKVNEAHEANASSQMPGVAATGPKERKAGERLHLHTINQMGAYMWFPASALSDLEFRASFPQMCSNCLTDKRLLIHLVQWPSKLPGWSQLGTREVHTRPVTKLDELPQVDRVGVLSYLPRQENLPYPYSLPFPYYVCEDCSPAGLIHTNTSSSSSEERCWLSVSNLDIACQFYAHNRGTDDADYHKLRTHRELSKEDRWAALPLAVRNRIGQWFKPQEGERFLNYIPDEDFSKAEAGAAGLVISDRRLVCHKAQTWRDYPLTESITVTRQSIPEGMRVELHSMKHGRAVLKLSGKSWVTLEQYLKGLKTGIKFVK